MNMSFEKHNYNYALHMTAFRPPCSYLTCSSFGGQRHMAYWFNFWVSDP